MYYSNTYIVARIVRQKIFTFYTANAKKGVQIVVILNKTITFAVYYYNTEINSNMEKANKIKLVVYKEHTLGYILPELPNSVQILHSSPLKGAIGTTNLQGDFHINYSDEVRLASESDFDAFRVSFDGYKNSSDYLYKQ